MTNKILTKKHNKKTTLTAQLFYHYTQSNQSSLKQIFKKKIHMKKTEILNYQHRRHVHVQKIEPSLSKINLFHLIHLLSKNIIVHMFSVLLFLVSILFFSQFFFFQF